MSTTTDAALVAEVDRVRAFNRYYTRVIGLLDAGLAGSPWSLTEARVLWELAHAGAGGGAVEMAELRGALELDSGYLSRVLGRLAEAGLVARAPSGDDGRRQVARLTEAGRAAFAELDARQADAVGELLAPLPADRRAELVAALDAARTALLGRPRPRSYQLREPRPGDLGWVVARHGALYAAEYGWDVEFEGMVAGIVADYVARHDPAREAGWIAEVDGRPVGSIFCVRESDETAKLRMLLVEPSARGLGIGAALVRECVRFARRAGYRRMVLWTDSRLIAARSLYRRAGFTLDREEPHHSYGHDLLGQYWSRDL